MWNLLLIAVSYLFALPLAVICAVVFILAIGVAFTAGIVIYLIRAFIDIL